MAVTFEQDAENDQAILDQIDAALTQAKQSSAAKLLFFLKDGEKALVRPLGGISHLVMLPFHERFVNQKPDPRAVCAKALELDCAWCAEAKASGDKKLVAEPHFFLQIYVHSFWKRVNGALEQVTQKGADGTDEPVCGIRLLEMKVNGPTSGLLAVIKDTIADDPQAFSKDYGIARRGTGPGTTYTFIAQSKVRPLPADLEIWTRARIRDEAVNACSIKTVDAVLSSVAAPPDEDEGDEFP